MGGSKSSKLLDAINLKILELSQERPIHPNDLAQLFGISRPAVDQRVSKLVAAGLVRKVKGRDSRVYVACTEAGAKILNQVKSGEPVSLPQPKRETALSVLLLLFFAVIAVMSFLANITRGSLGLAVLSAAFWLLIGVVTMRLLTRFITRVD